jgi:hypothetical protein
VRDIRAYVIGEVTSSGENPRKRWAMFIIEVPVDSVSYGYLTKRCPEQLHATFLYNTALAFPEKASFFTNPFGKILHYDSVEEAKKAASEAENARMKNPMDLEEIKILVCQVIFDRLIRKVKNNKHTY